MSKAMSLKSDSFLPGVELRDEAGGEFGGLHGVGVLLNQ
jgi:hypothetical protein